MYVVLSLTVFKLIPVTLSAAGIAGFILSIGMAVDANILIFERMKEELKRGKTVYDAMHEGFTRAWLSIRDSNISSIITAIVLFWLGTSAIKGFALTLGLGVLISMFTAISVSRTFLFAIAPKTQSRFKKFLFSNGFHF
jgi:protein-export membrane protein SecD